MASSTQSRTFVAELFGTFLLAFVVRTAIVHTMPIAIVPLLAAMTLGLCVYTLGPVSGCHINPAITAGIYSVGKIRLPQAALYLLAQVLGGFAAIALSYAVVRAPVNVTVENSLGLLAFGEAIGMFVFSIGVASVVYGKTPAGAAGAVIGGSLLLGILIASPFSSGVLNPAVALTLMPAPIAIYIIAPIVGSVAGFWFYRALVGAK